MNTGHVYPQKQTQYMADNLKLEDFEDMNPAHLSKELRQVYDKLQAAAQPKEEPVVTPEYEPATDLFA